jgi:hypothetical protein
MEPADIRLSIIRRVAIMQEVGMSHRAPKMLGVWTVLGTLLTGSIAAQAHDSGIAKHLKTIDNPGGGRIYVDAIAGQSQPQEALANTLHGIHVQYGDRPQLGRLVQSPGGEIVAGFFTVTAKKEDGKPMAGLALVYAPKSGSAKGAVLIDKVDRFPSTVNSMFATLKQELSTETANAKSSSAGSAHPKFAPAQSLNRVAFTDGTGVIGLPAGWQMLKASMGDVTASGPHGEKLRFGWTIPVIDPTNPQSASLMPNRRAPAPRNFVAIPFGTDPAEAFKQAFTQLARKAGKTPPDIEISKVQELPLQGGKNYMFYGQMDFHDSTGKQYLCGQMINTMPLQMGTWQMTLFVLYGPEQAMADEAATIAAIFPSWSRDNKRVNAMANVEMQRSIAETVRTGQIADKYTDDSNRSTAAWSDYLRNETVIVDTRTGAHARTSDDLAGALIDANPNRFEVVPESGLIRGLDY